MTGRMVGDAEAGYLEAVVGDCLAILGPDVEVLDVAVEDRTVPPVRLSIRYRLDRWEYETTGTGETVIEAHADLREALVIDRVRLGFLAMTDRTLLASDG